MRVKKIELKNWRNFQRASADLGRRVFLIGPNASGKSNFLDAFRFLADIAQQGGGGLQYAVNRRGGLKKIRCLSARKETDVRLRLEISSSESTSCDYEYDLCIAHEKNSHRLIVKHERVKENGKSLVERPNAADKKDPMRLTQTALEQISENAKFRPVVEFFESTLYLHLVPQLIRHSRSFSGPGIEGDPFGKNFLEELAKVTEQTRKARLRKIEKVLQKAVPRLKDFTYVLDEKEGGIPHLEATFQHWRPHGAKQRENDFSDGTLRLIGLCWAMLKTKGLLLLEEPELSLHGEIIKRLPGLFHRLTNLSKVQNQIIMSTHSYDLISDKGISLNEILLLKPRPEGALIEQGSQIEAAKELLEAGLTPGEVTMPEVSKEVTLGPQLELDLK